MRQDFVRRKLACSLTITPNAPVRTFLIADIRGYTRFTEEYGDEALAVFDSARQAIRAAIDLQRQFADHTDADADLPLRVGIGIDSGEAIKLDDGSFRGAALNVAARLCALAHGGEVIVSEGTGHLAGRLPGVRYVDRGRAHLKGIADTVRLIRVAPEEDPQSQPWIFMFFGGPKRFGWRIGVGVALIAAATAAAVVFLTGNNSGETSSGATNTEGEPAAVAPVAEVRALIPQGLRKTCLKQPVPDIGAVATAVCLPSTTGGGFSPDRWQVSIYPSGAAVRRAYEAERSRQRTPRDRGKCNSFSWGGEGPWAHGPGKPGGRRFCYFDGNDAVIVWTLERLGQANHRDILVIAREGGSDHARLIGWWSYAHHLIGKIG